MSNISFVQVLLTDGTESEQVNIQDKSMTTIMLKSTYDKMLEEQNNSVQV